MTTLETVECGDHIFGIYSNKEAELDEALTFLKDGLDKNEIIMLVTHGISKDEIRTKMSKEWNVNVNALESGEHIIIKTTKEWYYPNNVPNIKRITFGWESLVEIARIRNKKGLRVFADMSGFFKDGFAKEVVDYESTLESKFDFPLTAICACRTQDVANLTSEELKLLNEHHNAVWR